MISEHKLLIVAHWFPPAGGVTVQRALGFARYLPDYGYEIHVLAARNPPTLLSDPDLTELVPASVRVHRAFTPMLPGPVRQRLWQLLQAPLPQSTPASPRKPRPAQWKNTIKEFIRKVLTPDPEVVWVPFARRKARRLIRRHGISTVLVTAPPFSAFLIGQALKREFPNVGLISDFRDEWLRYYLSYVEYQRSSSIRRRAQVIEQETVRLSDLVLGTTEGMVREIRERYPTEPDAKFACLPNGYDPHLLRKLPPRSRRAGKLVVAHVGTVCESTSPLVYFEALGMLPEFVRKDFETWFIGRIAPGQHGISGNTRCFGFQPQAKAFQLMADADYLLVIVLDRVIVPAKTFEYLATGKPILGICPRGGELERLLQETRAGWCRDPNDTEGIRQLLFEAWTRWRQEAVTAPDWDAIRRYQRPRLAGELARLIEERVMPV